MVKNSRKSSPIRKSRGERGERQITPPAFDENFQHFQAKKIQQQQQIVDNEKCSQILTDYLAPRRFYQQPPPLIKTG